MMLTRRETLAGIGAGLVAKDAGAQAGGLVVMASFSILADVVARVGGPVVRADSLVGPDQDAHHFDPKPGDLARLARSGLVVRSGLGFEGWLDRLVQTSGYRGPVVTASEGIQPILVRETIPDPHVWQGFANIRRYAQNIEAALGRLRPREAAGFARRRAAFEAEVEAVRQEAVALIAPIPANRRLVVVPHNSFRYMGRELGLEFRGLRALSTAAQPSAQALAQIVAEVRASGAAAFFLENVADERLMGQLARESGARVGGKLYSDALSGPRGPAPNTIAMLRHNVRTIAGALRG